MRHLLFLSLLLVSLSASALERSKEYFDNIAATVRIKTDSGAVGTGLAIDKRHILTAGHVAIDEPGHDVEFFDSDGKLLKSIRAKTEKALQDGIFNDDIGLLVLDEDAPAHVSVKLSKDKVGAEGYTVGSPLAIKPRHVVIGTFGGSHDYLDLRSMSGSSAPGVSGAAVFNEKHEIVGVVVSGELGICVYFIPVEDVADLLKEAKIKYRKK